MIDRLQLSTLIEQCSMILALESWHGDSYSWSIQQRQRRLEGVMPRNECNFVERINDRSFELCHHLHVVNVLNVVALHNCNPPVDDHVLGMECPEDRLVEVDHLDVDIWYIVWVRDPDLALRIRKLLRLDREMIIENLPGLITFRRRQRNLSHLFRVPSVVHNLYHHSAIVQHCLS